MRYRHNETHKNIINKNISCAILAGGQSKRMGRHKAFLEYNGRKFIEIIQTNMSKWFDDMFIVTNDKEIFSHVKMPVFEDIICGKGPIGALYTALMMTKKDAVFCVPCDMPFLNVSVLQKLIEANNRLKFDCFIPLGKSGPEPLFGIYRKNIVDIIKKQIYLPDLSVRKILQICHTYYLDLNPQEELININTPKEYYRLCE